MFGTLLEPPLPQQALRDALEAAERALQAALAAMICDPALVSLLAERVLRASALVRKARRKLDRGGF